MPNTNISIDGERFLINGIPTYADIPGTKVEAHGLLMNARFIQGVFDDASGRERYHRFGRRFDPDRNTDDLIAALPEWYRYGLRAITVGFQGGWPINTFDVKGIENNPFGLRGTALDPAYAARMDRLIRGADAVGMVVIVNLLYWAQSWRLEDGRAVRAAVESSCAFLKAGGYTNVLLDLANEYNIPPFKRHPIVFEAEGMSALIDLAKKWSGGIPVGSSGGGGLVDAEVCRASDFILIHGNGLTRQKYYRTILKARGYAPGKPVVCNEDSQNVSQLDVAFRTRSSWGYYNSTTKQEPPADWSITAGEDRFFALRLAEGLGLPAELPPFEDQFALQGVERDASFEGKRWIRLAALRPELVDSVDFYLNGKMVYTCWDEPFAVNWKDTWEYEGVEARSGDRWRAVIRLRGGRELVKEAIAED